ncbi:hypothetical protein [Nonomuraea jabiensis]|uniref:hypothetical protein n=1 Tax=Nonomuraea jabiensis TaxID=882448 RepID=UPI0036C72A62
MPFPPSAKADTPIVQTIYTAAPAPLVHNGRVYVYTGHDEDGSTYLPMRDWHVRLNYLLLQQPDADHLRFAGGSGYLVAVHAERQRRREPAGQRHLNGKNHTTSVWVRSQSGTPSAKATLAGGTTSWTGR